MLQLLAGFLSVAAVNAFGSHFEEKATKAKQTRKAVLMRRENYAVPLGARDN